MSEIKKYFTIRPSDAGSEAYTDQYVEQLRAELERVKEANARHVIHAIERICPDCGDDMCGDEHKDCYKCKLSTVKKQRDAAVSGLQHAVTWLRDLGFEPLRQLDAIAAATE